MLVGDLQSNQARLAIEFGRTLGQPTEEVIEQPLQHHFRMLCLPDLHQFEFKHLSVGVLFGRSVGGQWTQSQKMFNRQFFSAPPILQEKIWRFFPFIKVISSSSSPTFAAGGNANFYTLIQFLTPPFFLLSAEFAAQWSCGKHH